MEEILKLIEAVSASTLTEFKYEENGVKYYFIDNEYYFKRVNFYGYFDDAERFAFFSKAAIDVMIFIDEIPDIIQSLLC